MNNQEQKTRIEKCLNCGGYNFDQGKIRGGKRSYYSSDKTTAGFGQREGVYPVEATLCLDCGFIHLSALGDYRSFKK